MQYKGKLLIAKPILNDPFFYKSVIYITNYEKNKGAVGFTLNKMYDKKLSELIPDIYLNINVYIGGPVCRDELFVIHSRPDIIEEGIAIDNHLFWSGNYKQIKQALLEKLINEDEIRFFIGYSGWGVSQLEKEIANEDWLINKNRELNILKWDKNLWENQLIKIDKTNIIWVNSPFNPELN